jgi:phage/conjugal plasmid C-4 type zinc finger TraR family protein
VSDIIDDAQAAEASFLDASLARVRRAQDPAKPTKSWAGVGCCSGCGDPIDAERLAALPGVKRCLQCQEARERRERGL